MKASKASPAQKMPRSTRSKAAPKTAAPPATPIKTLTVDIGGTGIKALIINELGEALTERSRTKTPDPSTPDAVLKVIKGLAKEQGDFDRVSVGFPGTIKGGVAKWAPNLAPEWKDFNLAKAIEDSLGKPARVANDADMQGYGAISGTGVECVLTLGTGVGSALFVNGHLVPNVELGKNKLNDANLKKVGRSKWNKRIAKAVRKLETLFNYDKLYIGGGNSKLVNIDLLPPNVTIVSNLNGLVGGIALWRE